MSTSNKHDSAEMLIAVRPSTGTAVGSNGNDMPIGPGAIKLLRLPQVMEMTGLRKTKIYELHAEGTFPRRVKITAHSVGWVEAEVQAWLARRIESSAHESATWRARQL